MVQQFQASDGRILNREQVEQEFKRVRLTQGKPTTGDDYYQALREWKSTYKVLTEKDQAANSRPIRAFMIVFGIFAFIAMYAGVVGGALAFFLIAGIGLLVAFGVSAIVTLFSN